jgi:hypothetical protein
MGRERSARLKDFHSDSYIPQIAVGSIPNLVRPRVFGKRVATAWVASWFGLRSVRDNGSQDVVVETMEALLIESLEPP